MKNHPNITEPLQASLLDEVPDAIIISDNETRVLYANKAAERILHMSRDDLAREILLDRVHPEDQRKVSRYAKLLEREKHMRTRRRIKDGTGEYIIIERNTQLMHDGTQLSICRKILPQPELHEEDLQERYASIAAQELRNSLVGIEQYVNLVAGTVIEKLPHDREAIELLRRAQQQISLHDRLIKDALNVSLLRGGVISLKKERFELQPFMAEIVFQSHLIRERAFELSVAGGAPREVYADKDRLYQALMNALASAAEYADPLRPIEVLLDGTKDAYRIDIVYLNHDDTSSPAFVRSPAKERDASDLLLRKFVTLHGGTLEILPGGESSTTIRIQMPLEMAAPQIYGASAQRILVVDDNETIANGLQRLLAHYGYDAHTAYGGRAALDKIGSLKPSFALLDISLPDIDGLEIAKQIRTNSPETKLIAISGYDKRAYDMSNFDAHLTKPVGISDILKKITELQA